MKQQTKTLLVWLGLIVAVLVLANLLSNSQKPEQITYSQFREQVVNQELSAKESSISVDLEVHSSHVNVSYENEGQEIQVVAPATDDLYKLLEDNDVQYKVEPEDDGMFFQFALMWLPVLLIVAVMIMFMRQMQAGGGKAMSFGKSKARLLNEHQQKVTFKDVAGIEEAREEVEEIIDFLRDTRKYMRVGGRIPKGVLLMGPPGTGKTLLARAIAGEAGVAFFSISGSDFVEMFVGVGASRVRDLFEQGKKNAPCIIFIDEIDAVGRHRGAGLGGGHDEREQTLNQLLVEMDGFEGNDGVILVAATNRPDVLDPALLRPGRFDRRIVVGLPDVRGREAILGVHTRKVPLGDDVDLGTVARGTPGFSGADLENLVNEAALNAARCNRDRVTHDDFDHARDKVMMGAERKSMRISAEEKRTTAWHEAGHTLVAALLPKGVVDPIHKVTIIPRGRALGLTHFLPEQDKLSFDQNNAEGRIAVLLGGRIAEELEFEGLKSTGAGNDLARCSELARKMVCEWGMSERLGPITFGKEDSEPFLGRDINRQANYSEATAQAIDDEVHRIVTSQYKRARSLLEDNYDALRRVSEALIEREVLTAEEVRKLIAGHQLGPFEPREPLGSRFDESSTPTASPSGSGLDTPRPTGFPVPDAG
ncbi:ATP-dependent metallopeptidase FtsH/Yme1/Tma family protein [Pseudenhygromyxa sp. WMMC2535]|uniref:ATP-dependent zinc metalloprotease FtsH n=1 Tax=Pseudenhygromyxa sp. WMMC2535 TaxID=2712867 RepID=UPI001553D277|nr:ATP-dependent metallopeptidase FtsH/Yme1/Tma family protein [Pseudenhygromyxa sp. WMMC2535]NVB43474.1 ATP-dependent metallopeptidase FtsH/Yme1/Tma family protein [Pseudenhygromyxa sp. WMMC2535]